tara:strand:- start:1282 stop:1872 length:591 start_codon:yes stop_codon:yes gene_type:complete
MNELLLRNVLKTIKEEPKLSNDIIDSFSDNQFRAKKTLIKHLLPYINLDTSIAILGCWYGSILIPLLDDKVNKIFAVDLDNTVIKIGKNRLFSHIDKIRWSQGDVFTYERPYEHIQVIINTSCEHMRPMKEWPFWKQGHIFALQSNNMYDIEGHINCVDSMAQFVEQLPDNSSILHTEEIEDSRGTRFLLVGQIDS